MEARAGGHARAHTHTASEKSNVQAQKAGKCQQNNNIELGLLKTSGNTDPTAKERTYNTVKRV